MKKSVFLIFVFWFLIIGIVSAADYYVSPTGSTSWSQCTNIGTPCSLSTANTYAKAGDTVNLRGGTYQQTINPANKGLETNRIVYKEYPGEEVKISYVKNGAYFDSNDAYITVDGIHFYDINDEWIYLLDSTGIRNRAVEERA